MEKYRAIRKIRISSFFILVSILSCLSQHVLASPATIVSDQTIADKFVRHTVTGITTPLPQLPDVPGFIGVSYLTIADLNNNGIKEIIATSGIGPDSDLSSPDGEVALFTWDGINKDAWTKTILNNTFAFPNETIVRDVDSDGDLDIVVLDQFIGGFDPGGVFYLENQGGANCVISIRHAGPLCWRDRHIRGAGGLCKNGTAH